MDFANTDGISNEGVKLDDKTDEELEKLGQEVEEEETSSESSTEKKQDGKDSDVTEDKKDEEEDLPFHKHPRWKAINDKNKELEENNKRLELEMAKISGKLEGIGKPQEAEQTPIADWFVKLYGADQELWEAYQVEENKREDSLKKRLLEEINKENQEKTAKQEQEEREAAEYINNSIQELKDSGEKFDTQKLRDVVLKYQPTDNNGNLDFKRGLEILKQIDKPNTEKDTAKKELVSDTVKNTKTVNNDVQAATTRMLRNKSFTSLGED